MTPKTTRCFEASKVRLVSPPPLLPLVVFPTIFSDFPCRPINNRVQFTPTPSTKISPTFPSHSHPAKWTGTFSHAISREAPTISHLGWLNGSHTTPPCEPCNVFVDGWFTDIRRIVDASCEVEYKTHPENKNKNPAIATQCLVAIRT